MKTFKLEARDQAAHFVVGAAVVFLLHFAGHDLNTIVGACLGFIVGSARESGEGWSIGSAGARDLLFWTLGGAFGGWIL